MNAPQHLRTEYLANPLGIDTPAPRLSWHPSSDRRGARQEAWQVICSGSADAVEEGRGDLWDSGRVESDQNHLVRYSGAPLSSFTRVYWRVRVWDDEGAPSTWSDTAVFETAALTPQDWSASWISMPDPSWTATKVLVISSSINKGEPTDSRQYWGIYCRKEFDAPRAPVRARACVCGLGYHELLINGQRIGSHRLDPGQTDYSRFALYSAHDATPALRPGHNVIQMILANGRYVDAYGFGKPRGIVQLLLWFADGSGMRIVTDKSWRCSHGPIRQNGIYDGELYDAREELTGWGAPGYDDTGWRPAEVVQGHPLKSQLLPPIKARTELPARSLTMPRPGVYVFDFGQNFSGVVRLRSHGPRGTTVTARFAELLADDGGLDLGTTREATARDVMILRGDTAETEVFEPRFTYHGFRYAEVTGLVSAPAITDAVGVVIHTAVEQTGAFLCSDPVVNRVHENVLWSQRSNLMSAPTDCPQRGERMGWLGDAQLASEEAIYNFDMAAFYTKYLDDLQAGLAADGSLSDVVPPYWPLYPADPAWGTAYVTLAWALWEHYGDRDALERHYPSLKRTVEFLASRAQGHIIRGMGKYGDWCPPGSTFPKKTSTELTSTWYYYYDTLRLSWIAGVLGKTEDKGRYEQRAAEIRDAFNTEFLAGGGRYRTIPMSPIDQEPGQTAQVLPLFLEMVPADQRADAVSLLQEAVEKIADFHVDTGIVGTRYLFEVLRKNGLAETAWKTATRSSYPGWGYMVAEGATTVWERWEKLAGQGMNSHNHIMFGTIDSWLYRTVGGLIPTSPGWRTARIQPWVLGGLTHAAAKVTTIHGELACEWALAPESFQLRVRVPVGVSAEVKVPLRNEWNWLREGTTTLWKAGVDGSNALATGVGPVRRDGEWLVLEAAAGAYEFELRS